MLPKPMGGETNFMSEVIKVERAHFLSRTGTAAISAPLRRSQCPSSQWTTEERVRRAGARAGALYAMGRLRGRGVTHYQILWKELATEGTSTFKGTKRRVGRLGRRTRSRGRPVGRREVWEKPGGREGGREASSVRERAAFGHALGRLLGKPTLEGQGMAKPFSASVSGSVSPPLSVNVRPGTTVSRLSLRVALTELQ